MKSIPLRASTLIGAILFAFVFARTSDARKVEGFETGDPAVTTIGDAGVRMGAYQGVVPPEGANQFLITTIGAGDTADGFTNQSGTNAVVANATFSAFFGDGSIVGTEGSGFTLSITLLPGESMITFNYDFLTNEFPPNNHQDLAFAVLTDSTNTVIGGVQTISTPNAINFGDPSRQLPSGAQATNPFLFDTGYLPFTISGLVAGTYTLAIGIVDTTTADIPSGLLIDNISVIPEPSTVALALFGVALLVGLRRWKTARS